MDELVAQRSGSILRLALNRPQKRNAMTSRMYLALADVLNDAAKG
jgi:enoyl-CoA hydratase/carnithine racemase